MGCQQPCLSFVPESVASAADVEYVAVMQQPVEGCVGDHGVSEELSPLCEALVGCEMMLPLSCLAETGLKKAVAASRSYGQMPN